MNYEIKTAPSLATFKMRLKLAMIRARSGVDHPTEHRIQFLSYFSLIYIVFIALCMKELKNHSNLHFFAIAMLPYVGHNIKQYFLLLNVSHHF